MTSYLITGANSFIGTHLSQQLLQLDATVKGSVRDSSRFVANGVQPVITGSIDGTTDWSQALAGVDIVYHLAATVHRPDIQDPSIYQTVIHAGTANLAQQAAKAGVKRLVFLSTASVYGAEAMPGILAEQQAKQPASLYGQAKWSAEQSLTTIAQETGLEIVIVRPPMVYGRGAPGNFNLLVKLIRKLPCLPFGLADKKRSFIGIDNLLEFLLLCGQDPRAKGVVFNVSDDQDMSLQELTRLTADILQRKSLLLPIPPLFMRIALRAIGKQSLYNKLFESFRLDVHCAKAVLNWQPNHTVLAQLQHALL